MARYQVILIYDGTHFLGFQRQGQPGMGEVGRTVQAEVEAALRKIGWSDRAILAAGRTDTGVHAYGQVIAFDLDWAHSHQALRAALNSQLPADISAREVLPAAPTFQPRYDARERIYQYRLFCQEWRDPLRERYAWRIWPPADPDLLAQAASLLPGTHDFSAFGTPPRAESSPIRSVSRAGWQSRPSRSGSPDLIFEIAGNAFLYHMVRCLVYYQVTVAQGRLPLEQIRRSLVNPPGQMLQGLAPAQGLTLLEVVYPESVSAGEREGENT